ncbi:hypothetical protein Dimus_013686, partial [Dionaea muscipula]
AARWCCPWWCSASASVDEGGCLLSAVVRGDWRWAGRGGWWMMRVREGCSDDGRRWPRLAGGCCSGGLGSSPAVGGDARKQGRAGDDDGGKPMEMVNGVGSLSLVVVVAWVMDEASRWSASWCSRRGKENKRLKMKIDNGVGVGEGDRQGGEGGAVTGWAGGGSMVAGVVWAEMGQRWPTSSLLGGDRRQAEAADGGDGEADGGNPQQGGVVPGGARHRRRWMKGGCLLSAVVRGDWRWAGRGGWWMMRVREGCTDGGRRWPRLAGGCCSGGLGSSSAVGGDARKQGRAGDGMGLGFGLGKKKQGETGVCLMVKMMEGNRWRW